MNGTGIAAGIDGEASQLQDGLGRPPNELVFFFFPPTRLSSIQSSPGCHQLGAGSERNKELQAGSEFSSGGGV